MPATLLFPQRKEATNLLVPVCSSASHVAYATVRMEPQFMILGHAAGVIAALAVKNTSGGGATCIPVQDVDADVLAASLLSDGAVLSSATENNAD